MCDGIFSRVRLRIDNEKKPNAMKWYSYLILLLMYIIYLAVGAYVFQMFEKPHEVSLFETGKRHFDVGF